MDSLQTQIILAFLTTAATLAVMFYVLYLARHYRRARGLLVAIALWLLSFVGGWASWLLEMVTQNIPAEFPAMLMYGVLLMLLPLFAGIAFWITQEIADGRT